MIKMKADPFWEDSNKKKTDYLVTSIIFCNPLYTSKKNSVFRVHGTQNNRLELTVSTQKLVLKNMHRIPRYSTKYVEI